MFCIIMATEKFYECKYPKNNTELLYFFWKTVLILRFILHTEKYLRTITFKTPFNSCVEIFIYLNVMILFLHLEISTLCTK